MESNEVAKGAKKPMDVNKLTMKDPDLEQTLMKSWIMTWTSLAIPNDLLIKNGHQKHVRLIEH